MRGVGVLRFRRRSSAGAPPGGRCAPHDEPRLLLLTGAQLCLHAWHGMGNVRNNSVDEGRWCSVEHFESPSTSGTTACLLGTSALESQCMRRPCSSRTAVTLRTCTAISCSSTSCMLGRDSGSSSQHRSASCRKHAGQPAGKVGRQRSRITWMMTSLSLRSCAAF